MNDKLYNELRAQVAIPDFISHKLIIGEPDESIKRHLSTKQTIWLTKNETDDIIHDIQNNKLDIGDYLKSLYADYEYTDEDEHKYLYLTDGYGLSEYFSKYGLYIPDQKYFNYVCTHPESLGMVNVYNGQDAKISVKSIMDKISDMSRDDIPGNFKFPAVSKVKFTTYTSTMYRKDVYINSYAMPLPVMCVNLPYEYYREEYIPENIYTFDVDSKYYSFAGMDEVEFTNYFNDICQNGIRRPIFVQIRNGRIISASDEDYLTILIATYLKLPSIPAAIYVMNNDQCNNSLSSNRPTDVAVMTNTYVRDPANKETLDLINRICEGNIVYQNNLFYGNILTANPVINGERINTFNYEFDTQVGDESNSVQYIDMHRKSYCCAQEGVIVPDPDEHLRQLLNDADKALDKKVDDTINKLTTMSTNINS